MRKILILISCILTSNIVFGQDKAKEYFLERSKKQKTTAWILLSVGAAAIITGVIIDSNVEPGDQSYTGGFIEVGGAICTLTSIPFFISASKNKKRAATLTIKNERILSPMVNVLTIKKQASVSLNITL